jgi:hypothetical protein
MILFSAAAAVLQRARPRQAIVLGAAVVIAGLMALLELCRPAFFPGGAIV